MQKTVGKPIIMFEYALILTISTNRLDSCWMGMAFLAVSRF